MGAEGAGSIVQYIDASPHRGGELTVSAMTRADLGEDASSFLRIKIEPDPDDSAHAEAETMIDTLDGFPIDHGKWRRQSATVSIPDHAGYIMFGANLIGEGCVSIDDVIVEIRDGNSSELRE